MKRTGGGPSSGYVSTGFFGGKDLCSLFCEAVAEVRPSGLALGRVLLLWVTKTVGERRAVFLYCAIAIGCVVVPDRSPLN